MAERWEALRASLWFWPTLMVLSSAGLAFGLINVGDLGLADRWPKFFGGGVAGSRDLLSSISTSMMTIAGVVFSLTIVALSLASTQYTSRVLRSFMSDRVLQITLGTFVGAFTYCVLVLRTIRDPADGDRFLPVLAVAVGLLYALVALAVLIRFIDHLSKSLQATHILESIAATGVETVRSFHPDPFTPETETSDLDAAPGPSGTPILSPSSGYIRQVDRPWLVRAARAHGATVTMERPVGAFVVEGAPLAWIEGTEHVGEELRKSVYRSVRIGRERSSEQDPLFSIRQLVDVALKALSPAMNESTTAEMAIDRIGEILIRLCERSISLEDRDEDGEVRLRLPGPTFEDAVRCAFDQVRASAEGNAAVLAHLSLMIGQVLDHAPSPERRRALEAQAAHVREAIERTVEAPADRQRGLSAPSSIAPR